MAKINCIVTFVVSAKLSPLCGKYRNRLLSVCGSQSPEPRVIGSRARFAHSDRKSPAKPAATTFIDPRRSVLRAATRTLPQSFTPRLTTA
jgi:hypothetical protein